MPYTTEDGGRLNNFAREPKIYQAETPTRLNSETIFCGNCCIIGRRFNIRSLLRVECKLTINAFSKLAKFFGQLDKE